VADDTDTAGGGSPLCAEYEQLRQVALTGHGEGWRHGLGVLAAKGVAGWMRACQMIAPPPAPPAPSAAAARTVSALAPGARELVSVIAAMALAHA
jgi:hypothetical protein